ncbi:hypothetical protein [Dethiobacter alkaliphilus]|uniref:hypothetical protein n=1 Tax=Dethiobacter alkaliphilus TaxID=427926 RepID=UPI0022263A40|nr:hypothetical protein [Dethiobacter alkaliphilus]MCW3490219.1 hypothetical protein [Dethiobacter alkaliphilus]
MIQAVLGGKSMGFEYTEDILTSTVFGAVKYLKPSSLLIPFIESAFLYDEARTPFWQVLKNDGIDLRCYQKVEYVFWPFHQTFGEPDLMIVFQHHVHGEEDLLLIIEAKFKSPKSGTGEKDQLVRYFNAIHDKNIEGFSEQSVADFKGQKGYILYLTESTASSEISDSEQIILRDVGEDNKIFHLRWHQLYSTIERLYSYFSDFERVIADDLLKYMEKVGLRDFSGISCPDESLYYMFSRQYPVFYNDSKSGLKSTYFDQLPSTDFPCHENIFFIEEGE